MICMNYKSKPIKANILGSMFSNANAFTMLLLIIYLIRGKIELEKNAIDFPSLYLSIPNVGEPVTYTVRNKLNL